MLRAYADAREAAAETVMHHLQLSTGCKKLLEARVALSLSWWKAKGLCLSLGCELHLMLAAEFKHAASLR